MRACLEINLSNFIENIHTLTKCINNKQSFFCPMVKADAYCHGATTMVKAIRQAEIKTIGVISCEDAVKYKTLIPDLNIYIFNPYKVTDIELMDTYHFTPVVGQWDNLKALTKSKRKCVPFHLKLNTGLNRFGFHPSEIPKVLEYIQKHPILQLTGLASHLSEGGKIAIEESKASQQVQLFKKICAFFQKHLPHQQFQNHLLSTAGWLALWIHSKHDPCLGFRPGMCLYGIKAPVVFASKTAEKKYKSFPLKPISCLKSFVVHSYTLPASEPISYAGTWVTKKKSQLAVVSMGYADGIPYSMFNKGQVLFRGERVPIVGRVYMDFFTIDVTALADQGEVQNGEEVVIFGHQKNNFISLKEQSDKTNSIPEELFTRLGHRVHKIIKSGCGGRI